MVRDLLEDVAYELERTPEMFAMVAPEYEDHLRRLSEAVLDYRLNLVEVLEHLEKLDRIFFDQMNRADLEDIEGWDHIIKSIDLILGVDIDEGILARS